MDKLQYCKKILLKVSFSKVLLRKEYLKALEILSIEDAESLDVWYHKKFENSSFQALLSDKINRN
jgi:hypothetical protein